jgi:hypothetical protein
MSWLKKHLYLLPVLLYLPAFFNFFSGDDWFHLQITQIGSIPEFLNFFSFQHTAQSAAFYRPLSTQVFFFVFQKLFGLTAWPYYLFVLLCFGYSLHLVYKFAQSQFHDNNKSLLTSLIYSLSVSNFTRIYFLSAFQEIALVIFSLLCLLSFSKSKKNSLIFFVFALLSKETAVVLPLLLLVFNFKEIKKKISVLIPFIIIWLLYLFLRLKVFGSVSGDSYTWNLSPAKAANTLSWYILWCFGAPELLVDYIGSGFRPIARLYTDYPYWWQTIFCLLFGTITSTIILSIQKIKKINTQIFKFVALFLITLSPVLFLPQHKFTLELGLPLVGFSLAIAWILPSKHTWIKTSLIVFYLALNLSMNYLTYTRSYTVNRSVTAQKLVQYFSSHYPQYPQNKYFEFINDTGDYGADWGSSKQISNVTSGSELFKVLYQDKNINVYFQDYPGERPTNKSRVVVSTKQFFQVQ